MVPAGTGVRSSQPRGALGRKTMPRGPFTFVAINLVVDLLYGFLDPRIRLGAKA